MLLPWQGLGQRHRHGGKQKRAKGTEEKFNILSHQNLIGLLFGLVLCIQANQLWTRSLTSRSALLPLRKAIQRGPVSAGNIGDAADGLESDFLKRPFRGKRENCDATRICPNMPNSLFWKLYYL